jgi:hypothetical protein
MDVVKLGGRSVRRLASFCALAMATLAFGTAPAVAAPTGFTTASCLPATSANGFVFISGGGAWAQTFTASGSGYARSAEIEGAYRQPGDNDDIVVHILATDASGAPTGGGIGHATVPGASIPVATPYTLTATFPASQAYLVNGKTYALALTTTNSSQDDFNQYGSNPCPGSLFVAGSLSGPWNGTFNPDNDLRFTVYRGPANDPFSQPEVIPGTTTTVPGSTQWATRQPGEPVHYTPVGGDIPWPGDHSVWYRWLALGSGPTTIDTCVAAIDSILAVYTGDNLGTLTRIADNNNACQSGFGSSVTFNAVAGTTYRIAVGDAGGARESTFDLAVNGQPNAAPTIDQLHPAAGSSTTSRKPSIGAHVLDSATELKAANIKFWVDGIKTAFTYNQTTDQLTHTPASQLSFGSHSVRIAATDAQGRTRDKTWNFSVVP